MPLPEARAICKGLDGRRNEVVGRIHGFGSESFLGTFGKRRTEGSLTSLAGVRLSVTMPDGNGEKGWRPKKSLPGRHATHNGLS